VTDEQSPATGDRPLPPGSPPILVDMSQQPEVPAPQGDQHLPGSVILVRDDQRPTPTAGEYRAAGYVVPEHDSGPVADDQVPGLVYADQRAPQGTVTFGTSSQPPASEQEEFAEGGVITRGTQALVGEAGPETVAQPRAKHADEAEAKADAEPEPGREGEADAPTSETDRPAASPENLRADEAAERAGRQAARAKEPRSANPHDRRTTQGKAWDRGWDSIESS
jgi:hypothetical protein